MILVIAIHTFLNNENIHSYPNSSRSNTPSARFPRQSSPWRKRRWGTGWFPGVSFLLSDFSRVQGRCMCFWDSVLLLFGSSWGSFWWARGRIVWSPLHRPALCSTSSDSSVLLPRSAKNSAPRRTTWQSTKLRYIRIWYPSSFFPTFRDPTCDGKSCTAHRRSFLLCLILRYLWSDTLGGVIFTFEMDEVGA